MKKTLIILGLILALGAGSMFVFADSAGMSFGKDFNRMPWNRTEVTEEQMEELVKERNEFRKENMEYRKENLKKALDNKEITQDEYNSWSEHFNYMEGFHEKNGFFNGEGSGRGCGGRGMMGRSRGKGMGWN